MLLVNVPIPDPSVVFEPAIVGAVAVDQHTPLAVTAAPPSAVISPPDTAPVRVIEVIDAVVRVGSCTDVVLKDRSFP
jgi:hypothetical protein